MPEDNAVFSDNDYSDIYDLNYKDTINKFRGIEGMSIDPYMLSKFLGKYLRIGSLIVDETESRFAKDIIKIFDYHTIIEHCYCIQVNSSDYGDSRITKPSKSEEMDEIRTKGGKKQYNSDWRNRY